MRKSLHLLRQCMIEVQTKQHIIKQGGDGDKDEQDFKGGCTAGNADAGDRLPVRVRDDVNGGKIHAFRHSGGRKHTFIHIDG